MNVEIRADGVHISGYVNVTGKMSRPVITGNKQKVVEVIEERAFEKALNKAQNVAMTKDHDSNCVLAQTSDNSLELREDAIGLHANAVITDPKTVEEAKQRKIRGWSFGMKNIIDSIEERADNLPLRHVKGFDLDHVTLVVNKFPCYAATSVELRADNVDEMELRGTDEPVNVSEEKSKTQFDNSEFKNRINALKLTK